MLRLILLLTLMGYVVTHYNQPSEDETCQLGYGVHRRPESRSYRVYDEKIPKYVYYKTLDGDWVKLTHVFHDKTDAIDFLARVGLAREIHEIDLSTFSVAKNLGQEVVQ